MKRYCLKGYRIFIILVVTMLVWLLILEKEIDLKTLKVSKDNINDSPDFNLQYDIVEKQPKILIRDLKQEQMSQMKEKINIPFILIMCDNSREKSYNSPLKLGETLLKSAALFTKTKLTFILVTNSTEAYNKMTSIVTSWPPYYQQKLNLMHVPVWYPSDLEVTMRRVSTHKTCHTEHILLPRMFPSLDAAIYIDNDMIFLRAPEDLWQEFENFTDQEMVGQVPCRSNSSKQLEIEKDKCWNGGMILFNLTRLKAFPGGWTEANMEVIKNLGSVWGNQGIFNTLWKKNPDYLHEVSCEWNYRKTQCRFGNNECHQAALRGVSSLHGNAYTFKSDLLMKAMYSAFQTYNLHTSNLTGTILELEKKVKALLEVGNPVQAAKHEWCGSTEIANAEIETVFLQCLRNHLNTIT